MVRAFASSTIALERRLQRGALFICARSLPILMSVRFNLLSVNEKYRLQIKEILSTVGQPKMMMMAHNHTSTNILNKVAEAINLDLLLKRTVVYFINLEIQTRVKTKNKNKKQTKKHS